MSAPYLLLAVVVTMSAFFVTLTMASAVLAGVKDIVVVVANGREEIRRTHYGRDMDVGSGWKGWRFPIVGWGIDGDQIISHWTNRGPGKRPDGSYYETHGVSFITYGGEGKFTSQYDLFDFAHQMRLCDELEEAGLLDPKLKQEWVLPGKKRLIDMLSKGISK